MPRILVATDLSPRADSAVIRAFRLAGEHGADVTALSVIDDGLPERLSVPLVVQAQILLEEFCELQPKSGSVKWNVQIERGDSSEDIHSIAEAIGADLIILGLHRRRALFDSLRETTLERIVRGASQPVLLVAGEAEHDYESVVAAIDFSPASTSALKAARRWAPGATISAFHAVYTGLGGVNVRDPERIMAKALLRDTERALDDWAKTGLPEGVSKPEIVDGAFTPILEAYCRTHTPQLIAIGAHARHGLAHWLLGGFASELIRDPPCDLLIGRPA